MIKEFNSSKYVKIGEDAKLIDRTPLTIKNWYEWAEQNDALHLLPEVIRVGERGIRHYKESELYKLVKFRDNISYGSMSDFNESKWGNREITEKRTKPFNEQ